MPSYKGWEKLDTSNTAWKFRDKIIVNGVRSEVVVHAYRQGSDVNDPEDYWAEIYFKNTEVEELSEPINQAGKVDHYANPQSSITAAEDNCREFLRRVQYAGGILQSVNAPAIPDSMIPDDWMYVEHASDYVLFEKSNQMANGAIAVDQEEDGSWKVTARGEEHMGGKEVLEVGLSFQEALDSAQDYMKLN